MPLTREQIATRLKSLRDSLGFTQAEVAQYLGLHRPAVSEIEAGRRAVSSEELYKFAELYATPIGALLAEQAPSEAQIINVLFRRGGPDSATTRTSVKRFIQRLADEKALEEILGLPPARSVRPGYRLQTLESKRDAISQGTEVASQERQRLGLGTQPIRNPLELLEQQGVRIGPVTALEHDEVDGLYFESEALGACVGVYVRQSDLTGGRAAFTAAHEYAHWLLQDIAAEFFTLQPTDDLPEVRANAFAAAFLMPEDGLRRYFADAGLLVGTSAIGHLSPGDVIRTMDHFGVSRSALLFRLTNLNLIRQALADELKTFPVETTAAALQIRFAARGNAGTRLPQLAVHAWRLGHISASRAADLCDMDLASFKDWTREIGEEQDPYDGLPLTGASAGA